METTTLEQLLSVGRQTVTCQRWAETEKKKKAEIDRLQKITRAWQEVFRAVNSVVPPDLMQYITYHAPKEERPGEEFSVMPNEPQEFYIVVPGFCPIRGVVSNKSLWEKVEATNKEEWVEHWGIEKPDKFLFGVPQIAISEGYEDPDWYATISYDVNGSPSARKVFSEAHDVRDLAVALALAEEYGPYLTQAEEAVAKHNAALNAKREERKAKEAQAEKEAQANDPAQDLQRINDILTGAAVLIGDKEATPDFLVQEAQARALVALCDRLDRLNRE